ncbi:MAG: hypothetical protein D6759_13690 [Chloroflexi bacterium]|nr:MAG: hypothetical protein D6759_13690 [Chloroflexota bacterium]
MCLEGGLADQVRIRIWRVTTADYDSGWVTPPQEVTVLQHNLGGDVDDYWVYLEFWTAGDDEAASRQGYGGDRHYWNGALIDEGAYWYDLTPHSIAVRRGPDVGYADRIRVRIWRVRTPDYDSGWFSISPNSLTTLYHNLGGPWNDFFVDLQFRGEGSSAPHHKWYGRDCYYQGVDLVCTGGYWTGLTGSRIQVYRAPDDTDAAQMRVRIWASREPRYDSGWQDIEQDELLPVYHNLGGDPDAYVVDVVGEDPDWGINHISYGGDTVSGRSGFLHFGIAWQNLTDTRLNVYRFPHDSTAQQVRARLWIAPFPDYDSGWKDIGQDGALTLQHNLGGSTDDYVVILDFKDDGLKGINQFWYGGDRVYASDGLNMRGAYWYGLDSTYIHVHRGADDFSADQVRVRIWRNSRADYESDWRYMGATPYVDFDHHLGQSPGSMVVDLQYRNNSGIHLHGYGRDLYKPDGSTLWQIGAYWSRLTSSSIRVARAPDDTSILDARVRIWLVEPRRVFLPLVVRDH